MADITRGTTVPVSFFSCTPDQTKLFTVCAGTSALAALQMASSFLDVARDSAYSAGGDGDDNSGFAAAYLVTMTKALVDSVIEGIGFESTEDRRFGDVLARLHQLCDEGVLVINPQAGTLAVDDGRRFLGWVGRQVKGGAA